MMTFEVLAVSMYAGIATVVVDLGQETIKFLSHKKDLPDNLDRLESVAIGRLEKSDISDLGIEVISPS